MINISRVSHHLQGKAILKDVSVEIPKGQLTALVGPNGAGKSTLLSLISRLLPLQAGAIRVDGLDVAQTPTDELARKLAILTQSNVITSRLRLNELVGFGRFPHHKGRPTREDIRLVDKAIEQMDLKALSNRFLDELSGGQRQKAFVAMAYAQNTDYLLLDEPLNNLDMTSARALMRRLRLLASETGKTIVIVVHEINYAALYADWIVGLRDGVVVAQGETDMMISEAQMSRIFDMEADIHDVGDRRIVMHYG